MTLYELIKRVSDIITPETGSFYNFVLYASDDNGGFLRTRYCWWDDKPIEDGELGEGYKTVLVTAKTPITEEDLTDRSEVESVLGTVYTKPRLQFNYAETEADWDSAEWDTELGYCYAYIFDLEKKTYDMKYIKCPYC